MLSVGGEKKNDNHDKSNKLFRMETHLMDFFTSDQVLQRYKVTILNFKKN